MNLKLILKALFIIAVLALLVVMGMYNPRPVDLTMPRILPQVLKMPAALMYFMFFGVGFVVGAVLMSGGGKKSAGPAKPSKS
jgi:hypothetical protein